MKILKLLAFLLLAAPCVLAQNYQLSGNFNLSQPVGLMSTSMDNAFGLSMELSREFKAPLSAGLQLNFGNYGYETTRQQYTFDDGSVTDTDVNVSNNLMSLLLTGKHFLRRDKKFNPYLSAKAGWSWFTTNLTIQDPADLDGCHPIDSEVISRDNTYTFSGGAGLRIDFNSVFKSSTEGRFYFDLSIHATHGGIVKYMNVDKKPGNHQPDQDVIAKFINTRTQVIHEHHVGYVYSSVLNMVEYRAGVVMRLNPL